MNPGSVPAPAPQDHFRSPLAARYAGEPMRRLFSERARIQTWRRLWIALADAERELGLDIPEAPFRQLEQRLDEIDFAKAADYESKFRHDVMAHLHTFAELCPEAKPFLHLGATSCYITDNADLIILREGLRDLRRSLAAVIRHLATFAATYRALPTLGFTHFQPAQPTTVGKRACLWLQDLLFDFDELTRAEQWLPLRGIKGTTGTQASFLGLFGGDHGKVRALDARLAERFGFARTFAVTGQTYPRKTDAYLLGILSGLGQSAAKAGCDLRLLANLREVEEPFGSHQIGSSAMAYKRNPMRAERMCSLARLLIHLPANAAETAAQQWMERTLDDSANRRIVLGEGFLGADAVLRIYHSIAGGLIVNEPVIRAHLEREIPFLSTEDVMMRAVQRGGDRQDLHERVRVHSRASIERLKAGAADNDLFTRLRGDEAFAAVIPDLEELARGDGLVGRSPEQVDEFLAEEVEPRLADVDGDVSIEDLNV